MESTYCRVRRHFGRMLSESQPSQTRVRFVPRIRLVGIAAVAFVVAVLLLPVIPLTANVFWVIPSYHTCIGTPAQFPTQNVSFLGSISYFATGKVGAVFIPTNNLTSNLYEFLPFSLPAISCA
jgi:hypothetical protein